VFFVMGADSWAEITTWHQWEQVLKASHHIVVTRPRYEIDTTHVTADVRDRIVDLRRLEQHELGARLQDSRDARIFFTDAVNADVSATKIRELAASANRDQLSMLVPPPVADYILKYELYKSE